jgi:multisubunit Na+/H+ antiporter MnhF subunit
MEKIIHTYMNNKPMRFNILSEAVKNDDGQTSMRRVVTFSTMMLMYGIVIIDIFTDYKVSEFIFDGLLILLLGGLGSIASEKFFNKKK